MFPAGLFLGPAPPVEVVRLISERCTAQRFDSSRAHKLNRKVNMLYSFKVIGDAIVIYFGGREIRRSLSIKNPHEYVAALNATRLLSRYELSCISEDSTERVVLEPDVTTIVEA